MAPPAAWAGKRKRCQVIARRRPQRAEVPTVGIGSVGSLAATTPAGAITGSNQMTRAEQTASDAFPNVVISSSTAPPPPTIAPCETPRRAPT